MNKKANKESTEDSKHKDRFSPSDLEKKYDKLNNLPSEQFEFLNEKTKVKITNRNIELNKDSASYKWKITGEKWEISLDGSIFSYYNNPPLINKI